MAQRLARTVWRRRSLSTVRGRRARGVGGVGRLAHMSLNTVALFGMANVYRFSCLRHDGHTHTHKHSNLATSLSIHRRQPGGYGLDRQLGHGLPRPNRPVLSHLASPPLALPPCRPRSWMESRGACLHLWPRHESRQSQCRASFHLRPTDGAFFSQGTRGGRGSTASPVVWPGSRPRRHQWAAAASYM